MAPTDDDAIPIESDELPAGLATLVTRACDNHVSTVSVLPVSRYAANNLLYLQKNLIAVVCVS